MLLKEDIVMAQKKLLVIVDYQHDFVDGSLGFEKAKLLDAPICNKIKKYTDNGDDVVFTIDTHEQKYLLTNEGKHLPVKHCIRNTPGWNLYGETAKLSKGKLLIEKSTYGSVELADFIRTQKYASIELCGVVTDICVIANAVIAKSASPESDIIVDAKCVASSNPKAEQKALDTMENLHIEVIGRD